MESYDSVRPFFFNRPKRFLNGVASINVILNSVIKCQIKTLSKTKVLSPENYYLAT